MKWSFRLFTSGNGTASTAAIHNFRQIAEEFLAGRFELDIVDIQERPEAAVGDHIVAIPTLVKVFPPPRTKVAGDLSNREQVLLSLGLTARHGKQTDV